MFSELTGLHALIVLVMIAIAVLWISAIVSITRAEQASGTERAVWILIVVLAPLLGALLWFAVGRRGRLT
jgi:hypothetical protein